MSEVTHHGRKTRLAERENRKPVGSHERQGIEAQMEVPVNLFAVLGA
jgi:hypothetical protein